MLVGNTYRHFILISLTLLNMYKVTFKCPLIKSVALLLHNNLSEHIVHVYLVKNLLSVQIVDSLMSTDLLYNKTLNW